MQRLVREKCEISRLYSKDQWGLPCTMTRGFPLPSSTYPMAPAAISKEVPFEQISGWADDATRRPRIY